MNISHRDLLLPSSTGPSSPRMSLARWRLLFAVLAVMSCLLALSVLAQALLAPNPSSVPQAVNEDSASMQARETKLKSRFDQIRTLLIALLKDGAVVPVAATETKWAEYTRLLNLFSNDYQQHLDYLVGINGFKFSNIN